MLVPALPSWVEELQQKFGRLLRVPLRRETGWLRADIDAYERHIIDAVVDSVAHHAKERLAIYNRQYWFRLLSALQTEFPSLARLLGHWTFNGYAMKFLLQSPPQHFDLSHAADGFADFVREGYGAPERDSDAARIPPQRAVREATSIDESFRKIFQAPVSASEPLNADAVQVGTIKLRLATNVALIQEHWPLLDIRDAIRPEDESAAVLPERYLTPKHWLIQRTSSGFGRLALEPLEFTLLSLLDQSSLAEAIDRLDAVTPAESKDSLPDLIRSCLSICRKHGVLVAQPP